jgi:hypothetical protein
MAPPLQNPFSQARWELEGLHLFHLPRERFARLEEPKPAYLVGTRGTGKTTLLKALNWELRLRNKSLQRQLQAHTGSEDLFVGRYVGVYFKLPRAQLKLFDDYVGSDHPLYTNLLTLHLALNWVDLLAEATAGLAAHGVISVSSADEVTTAAAIYDRYADYELVGRYLGPREARSLQELARGARRLREHLERDLQAGRPAEELSESLPVGQLGEFASVAANLLLELYPQHGEPWCFRVCMDEGEVLSRAQQRAMNSLVRVAERPLLPVLACTSLPEPLDDTDGRMKITKADVNILALTEWSDAEFQPFVEGVTSVRLQAATGQPELAVDLNTILGRPHVNELLEAILRVSSDSWGQQLLRDAETNRDEKYFGELDNPAPPIYQTFLVKTLALDIPHAKAQTSGS